MICFFVYNPEQSEYVGKNGAFVSSYHDALTWPTFKYLQGYLEDIVRFAQLDKLGWYAKAYVSEINNKEKVVYKTVLELLWHEYWKLKNEPDFDLPLFKDHSLEIVELLKGVTVPDVGKVKIPNIWG